MYVYMCVARLPCVETVAGQVFVLAKDSFGAYDVVFDVIVP